MKPLKPKRFSVLTRCGIAVTALCLGVAPMVRAEILEAELHVDGMTCSFCASNVESKLGSVEGVHQVVVFLDDGIVTVGLSRGNAATVDALGGAIRKAGFKVSGMNVQVRGTVSTDSAIPILDAGGRARFRLFENGERGVQPVSGGTLQQLREAALEGQPIVVTGPLYGKSGGVLGLVVEGIHLANGGARP